MCLIVYLKNPKGFSDFEFEEAARRNPDGVGFAWIENGKVRVKKFLDTKKAKEFFNTLKTKRVNNFVVHFRLASLGGKDISLVHPFLVSLQQNDAAEFTTEKAVLFHNGHDKQSLNDYLLFCMLNNLKVEESLSDSKAIAIMTSRLGKGILKIYSGKFLLYSSNSVFLVGDFIKDRGNYFSNSSYRRVELKNYTKDTKSDVTKTDFGKNKWDYDTEEKGGWEYEYRY